MAASTTHRKGAQLDPTGRLPLTAEQRASVDEFARVRQLCLAFQPNVNPHAARFAALEAELLIWCEGVDPEQPVVLEGEHFQVPVSRQEWQRRPKNIRKLFNAVGVTKFLAACSMTLTSIRKLIPKGEQGDYISETRTGPREIGEPVPKT